MITTPALPPRAGYVEVEIDGIRQYQKVYTEQDAAIAALQDRDAEIREQNAVLTETLDILMTTVLPALTGE